MTDLLSAKGAAVDGIYVCPHVPEDLCPCRKPRPGLIYRAAAELGFPPARSIIIGDKACDIALGTCIGAKTILVRTGYGLETERQATVMPDCVVDGLADVPDVLENLFSEQGASK